MNQQYTAAADGRRSLGTWLRRLAVVSLAMILSAAPALAAEASTQQDRPMIDLKDVVASNIPNIAKLSGRDGLKFSSGAPAPQDGGFFFVRYRFEIAAAGKYCLAIQGPASGGFGASRYSYVVDDGPQRDVLCRRLVTPANGPGEGWVEQLPVELAAGTHQLEFRFSPDQRVRQMNRVNMPHVGHRIQIKAVAFNRYTGAAAGSTAAPQAASQAGGKAAQRIADGQSLVLFGDSITQEGLYPAQLARLLDVWRPGANIACYNSGISLNRTWEALERLDRDVIALRPDWVLILLGVNDAVHMAPDEFARHYEEMVVRLKQAGINVICATPTGMLPTLAAGQGSYFHAPDRATGFDRTMAYEAGLIAGIAAKHGCPCVDMLAAFQAAGPRRASLMANQWHPNSEGGRLMALAILNAFGLTPTDAARSGDANDAECLKTIMALPKSAWPVYDPKPVVNAAPAAGGGRFIAVSSFSRNEVVVVTEAGQQVARVPVGHHPMGLAYSRQRKQLYVACEGSGTIDVISVPDFKRQAPIALGDVYPVAVALNAQEDTAWTGNFFGSSVSEIDLAAGSVRRQIPVGAVVENVMYLGQRDGLLAATRAGIKRVDLAKGEVAAKLMIGDHCDGLYRDGDGRVFGIDTVWWKMTPLVLPALEAQQSLPCPTPARAMVLDSAGSLWAGDAAAGRLVRRKAGSEAFEKVAEIEFPLGLAVIEPASPAPAK